MLRFILFIIITCCFANWCGAQNVKTDANGNYYQESDSVRLKQGIETGKIFTDKNGFEYPVLKSEKDKLFVVKRNKTGKVYRYYLKIEGTKEEN